MIDLDKLSALEKAATPGPWYAWRRDGLDEVPHSTDGGIFTISKEMCVKNWQKRDPSVDPFPLSEEVVVGCTEYFSMPHQYQTFEFIAEMRNQLPDLIACIDQQAARIKELDDAVSGPLENITKLLETVNADTIFAGVIQTWKNENQTLKSQIADLEKRNADLGAQVAALKEIAVEGWAVAEFGGEQEGQDYHLYFREWNIDRESYRKEARELLQAEHPEVFR